MVPGDISLIACIYSPFALMEHSSHVQPLFSNSWMSVDFPVILVVISPSGSDTGLPSIVIFGFNLFCSDTRNRIILRIPFDCCICLLFAFLRWEFLNGSTISFLFAEIHKDEFQDYVHYVLGQV